MLAWFKRFRQARKAVASAADKHALRAALQSMAGEAGRVAPAPVRAPIGVAAVMAIAAWLAARVDLENLSFALVAAVVVCVIVALRATSVRHSFIDELVARAGQLDYGLEPVEVKGSELWSQWRREFTDLNRGDEGQCIDRVTRGRWRPSDSTGDSLELTCFRFTYVTTSESTSTDSEGHSTTEKSSTTHHRYGVVARTPSALGVGFSEERKPAWPAKWTTSSIEFNRRFRIGALSEMAAARLFTPSTVQALSKFAASFRDLDLHATDDGLYVGFRNDDLLAVAGTKRRTDTIDVLEQMLAQRCAMPQLDALIEMLRAVAHVSSASAAANAHAAASPPIAPILEKA
jgi:hypothetical protein